MKVGSLVLFMALSSCGSSDSQGSDSGVLSDGGFRDGASVDSPAHGTGLDGTMAEGSHSDVQMTDSSPVEAAPDVQVPSCCTRSPSYDSQCTALGEPPDAYVCFCPGGSISAACAINMGTELVCCP
jgi:hypothetical protein